MTIAADPVFDAAVARWLAGALEIVNRAAAYHGTATLAIEPGPRYLRVVIDYGHGQRSAFAFLDRVTGDVLKTESWRKPAKHARGNLFDNDGGLRLVGPYGMAYLR